MKVNHNIKVKEPWFSHIINGLKVVEGRLYKDKFITMKVGDNIIINNENNKQCIVKIINLIKYDSFHDLLKNEGINNCLPEINDINHGVAIYNNFYTNEDQIKYGVLAIKFKP